MLMIIFTFQVRWRCRLFNHRLQSHSNLWGESASLRQQYLLDQFAFRNVLKGTRKSFYATHQPCWRNVVLRMNYPTALRERALRSSFSRKPSISFLAHKSGPFCSFLCCSRWELILNSAHLKVLSRHWSTWNCFPSWKRRKSRWWVLNLVVNESLVWTISVAFQLLCVSCGVLSLVFANGAGSYIFQLMDSFAGNYTLLIIAFFEVSKVETFNGCSN